MWTIDCLHPPQHGRRRGLYKSIFGRIMSVNGKPAFKALSPFYAFQNGHAALWCGRSTRDTDAVHPLEVLG